MRLLTRIWLAKYEIIFICLGLYFFATLPKPHGAIFFGIIIFKTIGLQVKFDKIISNLWFDTILGIYLLFLGHIYLGIFVFLLGRFRELMFGILPGEEVDKEYWQGNRFRPKNEEEEEEL